MTQSFFKKYSKKDILKKNVLETWVDGTKTYYNQKYFDDLAKKLSGRAVSLDIIEACGGGSARCMMAEVFLPKEN